MNHARLAPSSAGRWGNCPGSVVMEEAYLDTGTQGDAGEASHWVGSEILSVGVCHSAGETAPNGVVLDAEMVNGAQQYVDAVGEALQVTGGAAPLYVEQPVQCAAIHPTHCWGTPDLQYHMLYARELHVWDYKFGWLIVDVIGNKQLTCYASGLITFYQLPPDTSVVFHIVQPRPYHALGGHRTWRTTVAALAPAIEELRCAAYEALSPNPRITAGKHCAYCKARHACPAARQAMYAAFDYSDHAQHQELTPDALGMELMMIERAEQAIKYMRTGLEAQAMGLIGRGESVPGWTVERGQGRTSWKVPATQVFAIGDLHGVNLRKAPDAVTPAQARGLKLPAEVINAFSSIPLGDPKLVRSTLSITAQVFGPAAALRGGGA